MRGLPHQFQYLCCWLDKLFKILQLSYLFSSINTKVNLYIWILYSCTWREIETSQESGISLNGNALNSTALRDVSELPMR